jgi:hypothetical protein
MGGGGTSSHTNQYEKERIGVNKRKYGELADNGFQSNDEFKAATAAVQSGSTDATQLKAVGLSYDSTFGRYTLANGTDFEAAQTDWGNYTAERQEVAKYSASEERRKAAPTDLTGTSGNVDYDLAIKTDDEEKDKTTTTSTVDTSPSTASTNQPLGIY